MRNTAIAIIFVQMSLRFTMITTAVTITIITTIITTAVVLFMTT